MDLEWEKILICFEKWLLPDQSYIVKRIQSISLSGETFVSSLTMPRHMGLYTIYI